MIQHLSIMMDGNRRWAKQKSLMPWLGHKQGVETISLVTRFCIEKKIPHLSLYAFSLENFKRSEQEQQFIFNLVIEQAEKIVPELIKHNIRIFFIGDRLLFPEHIIDSINKLEDATKMGTALQVYLMFAYGGRQEIVAAAQKIAYAVQAGTLTLDQINTQTFKNYLWTGDIPDPDIIIRPGGRHRLSNYLLYQSAYSEYFFTDLLWPELTREYLEQVLQEFDHRQRNFGL